ncbi:tetratricopeptide repeat protein [Lentzea sp. JNUCC 0626]|uniref:tetratricopeptide repeat protein n=1 Tax=Lentzea sp. JNUCC 0626 TaxID=3367513 RepID=UPI003749A025
MRRDVFVGVGIDRYSADLPDLDHAVADVKAVAEALSPAFTGEPLTNADHAAVDGYLQSVHGSADGGTLLLMWSGHGQDLGGLRLATSDRADGVAAAEVIRTCVLSGASQLFLVIDACQAGAALDSGAMARRLLEQIPPSGDRVWLGMLVSCSAADIGARDGEFGRLLVKLLTEGPDSADQRRRWSRHNDRVLGEDLGWALQEEWQGIDQKPEFLRDGHPLPVVPNPLYDEGAPEEVVEHLLRAARGGGPGELRSWFTGRTAEVDTVVSWVLAGDPGVRVVKGSAGTGKSAVVGRVVSVSNPHERERLQDAGEVWTHADPGVGSVAAHVHLRGLTVERVAEALDGQLVRKRVLEPGPDGRRNAAELVGALQRVAEAEAAPPVVVLDGLDEARGHAFGIAEDLIARLAPFAIVVISTRPLTHQDGSALVDTLLPVEELNLDSAECLESARAAIGAYVRERLTGVHTDMDSSVMAEHLTGEALAAADRPFLLARVITDQLRARPVSTLLPQWQDLISHSIEDAFDADLARVEPQPGRDSGASAAREVARAMLTALTWALGAGFPEQEWLTVASVLADTEVGRDDVSWVLDQLGRYVVQDGDSGVAVYRLAHQSFADHLRPPFRPTGEDPFNPTARTVTAALLQQYKQLLAEGVPARTPMYLWRYAWIHAANAGFQGLTGLRHIASTHFELQSDVALAALQVAETAAAWGRRVEAVAPTEEAVTTYRALAEENPTYLPDLAMALNNLAIGYGKAGRDVEAVAPAEEAVTTYQALTAKNPTHLPNLAGALNNLGGHYSAVGRWAEAVAPAEEAVTTYRALAAKNPTYLPDLAMALNNLGIRYSEVGQLAEAVAPVDEAVTTYRALAEENPAHLPDLAGALNNLGNRYSTMGRHAEAVAPVKEAVTLRRTQAKENPAYTPDLAAVLNNLSNRYSDVGQLAEAVAPVEEAVTTYRALAEENPAYLPNLASALNNLGNRYSAVGRRSEATTLTEEAVTLRRALAEENSAYLPDLAMALNNLGGCYNEVGRHTEAMARVEEAVTTYRALAEENHAYLPDLAMALNNLAGCYNAMNRHTEAMARVEEAVTTYRALAEENHAYLPDLAMALNNLASCYNAMGQLAEALVPAEEAVTLRRTQAKENPAYLPNLALALNNLGSRYSAIGRHAEGVTLIEEAVTLRRTQAKENPAYHPNLALALNNLGSCYNELSRYAEAVALTKEAVTTYRALAEENHAYLPDLAMALNNLASCYNAMGQLAEALAPAKEAVTKYLTLAEENPTHLPHLASSLNNLSLYREENNGPDAANEVWLVALASASKQNQLSLLVFRAAFAHRGDPRTAVWLYQGTQAEDRGLSGAARSAARLHWAANPDPWAQAWTDIDGSPLPPWLILDPEMLEVASGWIETRTYEDECHYLTAHPEILDGAFDVAVDESLLELSEADAFRFTELRTTAQSDGIEVAYKPLLLAVLIHEFVHSSFRGQQELLLDRRADLLDSMSFAYLDKVLDEVQERDKAEVALALLHLAKATSDDFLAEVFTVLNEAGSFADLLHTTARESDAMIVRALAVITMYAAQTANEAADALFYFAVANAIDGDDSAPSLLNKAVQQAPDNRNVWISRLAGLGATRPAVLTLIPTLTEADPDA